MPESARVAVPRNISGEPRIGTRILLVGTSPEKAQLFHGDSERVWHIGIEVLEAKSFADADHWLEDLRSSEIQAILVNLVGMEEAPAGSRPPLPQSEHQSVYQSALESLQRLRIKVPFSALIVIIPGTAPELADAVFKFGANDCLVGGILTPEALARSLRFNIDRHKNSRVSIDRSEGLLSGPAPGYSQGDPIAYRGTLPRGALQAPLSSPLPSHERAIGNLASNLSSSAAPSTTAPSNVEPVLPNRVLPNTPFQAGMLVEANELLKAEIAERRRTERMLREAMEKAEAANRAKSEFLARISHEIRTPMNGIVGMTELVLDTDLNSRQREYLHLVSKSAESLLNLINDILDFSKIEAGKLEIENELFSLRDLMADAVRSLGVAAALKGLELVLDIQPEVPFSIVGDAGRLRQVLINLIGNAVKFTDSGGVTVSVTLTPVRSKEEEPFAKSSEKPFENTPGVLIQVADTGIGIPAGKLDEIFNAFAQVDPSSTRRHTGTGLGLSITKNLVEQLGGEIRVESIEGKGSLFELTLPISKEVLGANENGVLPGLSGQGDKPAGPGGLKGLRALVLEAHPAAAKALVSILTELGIVPEIVKKRDEAGGALENARREGRSFNLLLIGSTLEGDVLDRVAGTRFCDAVAMGPEPRPSIVLMLPPASTSVEVQRAWTYPSGWVLSKPVFESSLRDAIYESLRSSDKTFTGGAPTPTHPVEEIHLDRFSSSFLPMPSRKILVVEDNLISQRVAETILSNEGYLVALARNGREAIDALLQEPFDLVLMDLQMPEMDGLEATKSIRSLGHMRGRVPIIATTAHAMKGDRERCMAVGMDHYLPKPFHKRELLDVVASAIKASSGPISS